MISPPCQAKGTLIHSARFRNISGHIKKAPIKKQKAPINVKDVDQIIIAGGMGVGREKANIADARKAEQPIKLTKAIHQVIERNCQAHHRLHISNIARMPDIWNRIDPKILGVQTSKSSAIQLRSKNASNVFILNMIVPINWLKQDQNTIRLDRAMIAPRNWIKAARVKNIDPAKMPCPA